MTSLLAQAFDSGTETSSVHLAEQFREMELTLNRIEYAATHYDVLGTEIDSSNDHIKISFKDAVESLQTARRAEGIVLSGPVVLRIDKAIARLSHAFKVLSDEAKRLEYDKLLFAVSCNMASPGLFPEPETSPVIKPALDSALSRAAGFPTDGNSFSQLEREAELFGEFACIQDSENRRRFERVRLSIPVYVTGHHRFSGEWHEMTQTIDVSRTGALVRLRKRVHHRMLLHLALPLPMAMRCYRHSEPSYGVYALVRRIEPPLDHARIVAVEFVGERPPALYFEKPWATYATKWSGIERRRSPRQDISEAVEIEYLDERRRLILEENAVAENASSSGLRVSVKSAPRDFEMLKVTLPGRGLETLATVCNRYVGKDRLERLCIQYSRPHF